MNILLLFIRNPQPGKVKTRLARTLGDAEALRIYLILLEKTRLAAGDCMAHKWLFYTDFIDPDDAWDPAVFNKKIQASGDLGQRMEQAFQEAFAAGAGKVCIIGSDCPDLSGALLDQAFAALDAADCVIGPAQDGGYYLLGMKKNAPFLFRDMEWSTETVLENTLRKMDAAGLSHALLPMLMDVDTEEDWRASGHA